MKSTLDIERIVKHWMESANEDNRTMKHLFDLKDYHWSLFIGHLVIEKLLKAIIVRSTDAHAPYLHDLVRLAEIAQLPISEQQKDWLDTITTFHISARYETYKQEFRIKCTLEFTSLWISRIESLCLWIQKKL